MSDWVLIHLWNHTAEFILTHSNETMITFVEILCRTTNELLPFDIQLQAFFFIRISGKNLIPRYKEPFNYRTSIIAISFLVHCFRVSLCIRDVTNKTSDFNGFPGDYICELLKQISKPEQ